MNYVGNILYSIIHKSILDCETRNSKMYFKFLDPKIYYELYNLYYISRFCNL